MEKSSINKPFFYTPSGILFLVMLFVLIVLFCKLSSRAFTDSYLWMDEAGQYFISKGLCHHSDKLAPEGTLSDLINYNRSHNLDPGGFGLVLRWWMSFGNNYIWLRLLPLAFFITCILLSFLLGKKLTGSSIKAVVLSSILLIHPAFSINSCEIRAYSMEMLGVVLSLFLLNEYKDKWGYGKLILLSLILAVFMTSRYSFILYSASIALFLFYDIIIRNGFKDNFIKIIPFSLVLLVTVAAIYLISFRYQLRPEGVGHVKDMYIGSSLKALISPQCIRAYCIFLIVWHEIKKKQKVSDIIVIATITSLLFMIASLLNLYPVDERRAMSLTMIQCFALLVWIVNKIKTPKQIELVLGCVSLLAITVMILWPKLTKNRQIAIEEYSNFKELLNNASPETLVAVCSYYDASVRYGIEAGDLKNIVSKDFYLNNILLDGTDEGRKIIIDNLDEIRYFYYKYTEADKISNSLSLKLKKEKQGIFIKEIQ